MTGVKLGLCFRVGLAGLALIFFCCSEIHAQDDYYPKLSEAMIKEANDGQYASSLQKSYEVYGAFPADINANIVTAFNLINLGRYKEANGYISNSFAIDPTNFSTYFNAAYYSAIDGDVTMAKKYLSEATKLYRDTYNMKEILDEIRKVGTNVNKAVVFNQLADWYEQQQKIIKERYPSLQEAFNEAYADPSKIREVTDKYVARFTAMKWPEMALGLYGYACIWLREQGRPSEAASVAEAGFSYYLKNGYGDNPYQAAFMMYRLIDTYVYLGNDEKVVDYADEVVALTEKLPIHVDDVRALIDAANAYGRLGQIAEQRRLAGIAYKLAEKYVNRYDAVQAANSLCGAYVYKINDTDTNDAVYYGEQALQIAQKYHFEDLLGPVMGNLAVAYYRLGTRESQEKSTRMYGSLIEIEKQKKMWSSAALNLNNLGAMMFNAKGYEYAAGYFEESIALAERDLGSMSSQDKLTFYQSQVSAYQFLIACYAFLDNPQKVYEAMEGSRSRVLTERLAKGKSVKPGTIKDLQAILQPDEAAIFYSLFSGHEVIILVVTKKYSKVVYHNDDTFIGNIKDKYLERLAKEHGERKGQDLDDEPIDRESRVVMADFKKVTELTRKFFERPGIADDVLKEYLQGYYKFLILPVLNRLTGVKKLMISPDEVLNYIPFEALQLHDGSYLVQKYDVKYLNSTGALSVIQERQYPAGRKPLIAMGGAIYEENLAQAPQLNTQHDLNALTVEVSENVASGASQRRAYAALFGNSAMNPLPGTLEEVNSIAKNVPKAEVYSGRDFTENRLKSMSKTGALKQYKVLHLATHGFVVEEIPDLSGVAMSVFTKEEGGEDGFLNVNEIASLDLNADLTVLSACQTALGKIYSGEGVTGLTQSLLIAGSNAALVSLWPVNDASTSMFMSDFYKEAQKGKPYAQIVAELKRRFIKGDYGDEFKHPNFWAPFVYFGK